MTFGGGRAIWQYVSKLKTSTAFNLVVALQGICPIDSKSMRTHVQIREFKEVLLKYDL